MTTASAFDEAETARADTGWFVNGRFGMFIHYGAYSVAGRHEWVQMREFIPVEEYGRYAENFTPDLFDAGALMALAVRAGCTYVVFTTKHHEGFCLWDTAQTDYSSQAVCGRDLVREYVDAARSAGLRVGLYHSVIDWHHPDFLVDCYHPDRRDDLDLLNAGRDMSRYRAYLHAQAEELLTRYGKIDLMFYDFTYPDGFGGLPGKEPADWDAQRLLEYTRRVQPGIVVNNRLGIPGDYETPEQFQPTAPVVRDGHPVLWEACHTINGSWGYDRDNLEFKDPAQLVTMLVQTVSLGGNLILNVGPTARGEVDQRDFETFCAVGEWMRLHSASVRGCGPATVPAAPNCCYTQNGDRLYVHVLSWPLRHLHLPGLRDRIKFARMLNDGSEVIVQHIGDQDVHDNTAPTAQDPDNATLLLSIVRPNVLIPVIEITLNS